MTRIGVISDTHAYWDERYRTHFEGCDEIWHAGDIGSWEVAEKLSQIALFRAVHGNCDGGDVRRTYPEIYRFKVEDVDVLLKHIGGTPGHYDPSVRLRLSMDTPQLFVCGHSHILKVQHDADLNMLYMNPGAAGLQGWQTVRTLLRFNINGKDISDLEVIEMPR